MAPRSRTRSGRPVQELYYDTYPDGQFKLRSQRAFDTSTISDKSTGPCNATHVISYPFTNSGYTPDRHAEVINECYFFIDPGTTYYIVSGFENSLNWKKLNSSNEAGLLQNLAELDDTVAMFGKKLLSSVSYGGYKWGWAPLLNDVSAVADTVKRCSRNPPGLPQPYSDENTITKSVSVPHRGGVFTHTWELKTKYEGFVSTELDILSYYDFIGFHPSPKVIWDLVPLSFAVDYVLPIGDMLDRISPTQGWVKAANFTGWKMTTATVTEKLSGTISGWHSYNHEAKRRTFSRSWVSNFALEQKTAHKEIGLKWPTFTQILDYAYLAKTFTSGRRR